MFSQDEFIMGIDTSTTAIGIVILKNGKLDFNITLTFADTQPFLERMALANLVIPEFVKENKCTKIVIEQMDYFRNAKVMRVLIGVSFIVFFSIFYHTTLEPVFVKCSFARKFLGLPARPKEAAHQALIYFYPETKKLTEHEKDAFVVAKALEKGVKIDKIGKKEKVKKPRKKKSEKNDKKNKRIL